MPDTLPAILKPYRLVNSEMVDDHIEFTYQLGLLCVDVYLTYRIEFPDMAFTWSPYWVHEYKIEN